MLVARLVEFGHTGEVELQAGRGEWFCAPHLARDHAGRDRQAAGSGSTRWSWPAGVRRAAVLLAPFRRDGLMAGCGRLDEAVELASAHPEGGTGYAAETVAGLLAGGRTQEAVDLLERRGSGRGAGRSRATFSTSAG